MGYSAPHGKSETLTWVTNNLESIDTILDIGPGLGTYYNLLSSLKQFNWSAVEAWEPYIIQFDLSRKYNTVYNQDIRKFDWDNKFYDLIIAGDILEHMTKEEAITVVDHCLNNGKTLIISIPIRHMEQDDLNGNPFEVHVKPDWTHQEVLETWGNHISNFYTSKWIGVYWLSKC
jgi:predicted TPR repeat methyltransferase